MTPIDPTALLALTEGRPPWGVTLDVDTVRALVAAYVERDALRGFWHRDSDRADWLDAQVTAIAVERDALRAAVARMAGPEAVEAVATALAASSNLDMDLYGTDELDEAAAAAVRAIAALGAP
jgi:hypothetical protein